MLRIRPASPVLLLALCVAAASPLAAHAQEGTLKKIKDTGSITLGHRESSFGFSYNDGGPTPVGSGPARAL